MNRVGNTASEIYTEAEAAAALGISLGELHLLLDRYVFNQGGARPREIEFTSSDLLLLGCWVNQQKPARKRSNVLQMPKPGRR